MNRKGSERFFIVLVCVSFIIVVTGATFAYFTASSRSAEEAVATSSHFVAIAYNEGKIMRALDLIPSTEKVAMFGYHGLTKDETTEEVSYTNNSQCVDDNNYSVCSTYSFEVTNMGSIGQYMGGFISLTDNQFTNLKYILYDTTNVLETDSTLEKYNKRLVVSRGDLPCTYSDGGSFEAVAPVYIMGAEGQVQQYVEANETKKYEIVIWLQETGDYQEEQGFVFKGKVTVSLTDEDHVKGYIEKAEKGDTVDNNDDTIDNEDNVNDVG